VESSQQTDDWKLEKITFDAAYGNERIIAYLFLPRKALPPFETVVYFPGAGALHQRSSAGVPQLEEFDFVIKSGRAVMFPLYKATFERGTVSRTVGPIPPVPIEITSSPGRRTWADRSTTLKPDPTSITASSPTKAPVGEPPWGLSFQQWKIASEL